MIELIRGELHYNMRQMLYLLVIPATLAPLPLAFGRDAMGVMASLGFFLAFAHFIALLHTHNLILRAKRERRFHLYGLLPISRLQLGLSRLGVILFLPLTLLVVVLCLSLGFILQAGDSAWMLDFFIFNAQLIFISVLVLLDSIGGNTLVQIAYLGFFTLLGFLSVLPLEAVRVISRLMTLLSSPAGILWLYAAAALLAALFLFRYVRFTLRERDSF